MKKTVLAAASLFVISAGASTLAFAEETSGVVAGPYIGISGGIGGMDTPKLSDYAKSASGNYSESLRSGVAGRAYAGYLFGDSLKYGLEVGGAFYPNNKYSLGIVGSSMKWTYSGYNVDVLGVLRQSFSNFNIFAKAGLAYTWQKLESQSVFPAGQTTSISTSKVLPEVAVGFGYDFTPNFGANLAYSHIFGNKPDSLPSVNSSNLNRVASVNMLTLGLNYHFDLN